MTRDKIVYTCECCFITDDQGNQFPKVWPSKTHYNRHLSTNKITGNTRKPQKERCDKQTFECELCGKGFRNNWFLSKHTSCKTKNTFTSPPS